MVVKGNSECLVKRDFYDALEYAGLSGKTICVGLAHGKKDALWRTIRSRDKLMAWHLACGMWK